MSAYAVSTRGFFESHVAMPLPDAYRDLADRNDSTRNGRLLGFAILLASVNVSVAVYEFALPAAAALF